MKPIPAEVVENREECERTIVLRLRPERPIRWEPGQFLMLGISGVDEKPMAFSGGDDREFELTIEIVGPFTERCADLEPGDVVWVRGPYGKPFEVRGSRAVVVAGGTGVAPLVPLVERLRRARVHVTSVLGGPHADRLPRKDDLEKLSDELYVTTEDGSEGRKGFPTDVLEELVEKECPDVVYACGPEGMLVRVAEIAREHDVPCQVSVVRYVKCGEGICGSCALGKGLLVCRDGPVFWTEELEGTEFGGVRRDVTGKPE
ncbi:dihydroorotate dehydrogenase electron transfer subunit [Methanopyrus kandleri]|uniref:dihydroorotate dehydrogenase electron transfer subunit n=1 Tax=Methanopyrus kandleri TaxID=2320 RepID=UPI000B2240C6|nr:dihydroorotate dehydrogenase electron transfer subunit [Methanopyrus kandleri]